MVFKTVNHFPKIKEEFSVKGKMFSVGLLFYVSVNTVKYGNYFSENHFMSK